MSSSSDSPARAGRLLPSIFDGLPAGTPLSLDDLDGLMRADTERRILAVLERALPRRDALQLPAPTVPE